MKNRDLIEFQWEIRGVKKRDRTLFALKNVRALTDRDRHLWEYFKRIMHIQVAHKYDYLILVGSCQLLAFRVRWRPDRNSNSVEFRAWMKNKLAAIRAAATDGFSGVFSAQEFTEEMSEIHRRIFGAKK